jgi:chloride channel protein, CIC family
VGLLAGLGAVVFRWMIRGFQRIFFGQGAEWLGFLGHYYVVLLPAVGGLLFGPLIYFLAREAKGEGPPEVMEAVAIKGGRIRSRVAAVKALASAICIGSGGSVGREGPIVQIGSSVGSAVGQWLTLPEEWIKTLVLCGAAGGISATFNAPIGGIFFALEVIQRRFIAGNFGFVVISSVTADFIAHRFLGSMPSFIIPPYSMASNWEILPYALLGILAGLFPLGFIRFFYKCEDFFSGLKFPEYLKPVLGGIVIGLIGLYYFDVFGVGYGGSYGVGGIFLERGGVDKALVGEIGLATLLILMLLKIFATSVTLGSGGSGGIFAPSLFMGAMLGGAIGIVVYRLFPTITISSEAEASGAYALVGMGAFFATTVHGPITAIIMLFEMTRNYDLILPLMTAVVISMLTARAFSRESIYTLKLVRRGVDVHQEEQADMMKNITVGEVMTHDFPTVPPSMRISELMEELHQSGHHGFPIVDENGSFCGIVTLQDVEAGVARKDPTLTAGDIATKSPVVAYPDQSIHDALAQFGGRDVGRIPVVDRNNPKKLLGVLRRHDVVRAYTKAVAKKAVREKNS